MIARDSENKAVSDGEKTPKSFPSTNHLRR
jgi:hypothetical protein